MSTVYDWSPVFGALNNAMGNYATQKQYGSLLDNLFAPQTLPGAPAQQSTAQLPTMQMPGASMPAQVPGNQVTARMPGGYHPQIGGGNISVGGGQIDTSTAAIAPQTTYSGPLAQRLGDDQSNYLYPMLKALGPGSMPRL